jgi:hypothetical protein
LRPFESRVFVALVEGKLVAVVGGLNLAHTVIDHADIVVALG